MSSLVHERWPNFRYSPQLSVTLCFSLPRSLSTHLLSSLVHERWPRPPLFLVSLCLSHLMSSQVHERMAKIPFHSVELYTLCYSLSLSLHTPEEPSSSWEMGRSLSISLSISRTHLMSSLLAHSPLLLVSHTHLMSFLVRERWPKFRSNTQGDTHST